MSLIKSAMYPSIWPTGYGLDALLRVFPAAAPKQPIVPAKDPVVPTPLGPVELPTT